MKDFSIESILADTFTFEQTGSYEETYRCDFDVCEDIRKEADRRYCTADATINVDGTLVMSKKNHVEDSGEKFEISSGKCCDGSTERAECIITNLKKTQQFGEENGDANLRQNREVDVEENLEIDCRRSFREFYINFERYGKDETWKNSPWIIESEHNRHINKLNSNLFDSVGKASKIMDVKSNFTTVHEEKDTKNCGKVSKLFTDEGNELNYKKNREASERIGEYKMNVKNIQLKEFHVNSTETDTNNSGENSKRINRRKDFVRHLKRDKRRKFDKEKRRSKKNQSEVLNDGEHINSNENCNSKLFENGNNLTNNLNEKSEISTDKIQNLEATESIKQLEWLQFTRYKPPRIPRKPTMGKNKRKPSLHPRIPFSTSQLDFLEQKFRSSAYLSKNDVLDISVALKLPSNRVKIWFQNRRARERREFHANIK